MADNVATAFAGGTMMLPCTPPATGANAIDAGPCGVATVELLATGGNVGEGAGDGVATDEGIADDPPPPPHPTALAANASNANEYFAVRHKPMSYGSGTYDTRLVISIDHKCCARACYSVMTRSLR